MVRDACYLQTTLCSVVPVKKEEEKLKVEESIKKEKLENQEEENTLFKSQQASVERVTQLTRV